MAFPWQIVAALSAAAAYLTTSITRSHWSLLVFIGYYALSFVLSNLLYLLWSIILYPKFFSPLRSLPEPKNPSWYNGQWQKIMELQPGVPMEEWYRSIALRLSLDPKQVPILIS